MQSVDSLEMTLILWGIGGRRRRGQQRMRWLDGLTDSMDMGLSRLRELVLEREARCAVIHGVTKSQTWLSDWTELNRTAHCSAIPCFHTRCLSFPLDIKYIDHIRIGLPHWATQCAIPFTGRCHSCGLQFEGRFSVKSNVQHAGHWWQPRGGALAVSTLTSFGAQAPTLSSCATSKNSLF